MSRSQAFALAKERNERRPHFVHVPVLLYGNVWGVQQYVREEKIS